MLCAHKVPLDSNIELRVDVLFLCSENLLVLVPLENKVFTCLLVIVTILHLVLDFVNSICYLEGMPNHFKFIDPAGFNSSVPQLAWD